MSSLGMLGTKEHSEESYTWISPFWW